MGLDLIKKKAKLLITLLLILTLSLGLINTDIFADYQKFKIKDVEVETSTNSISIKWGDLSDSYIITLDGQRYTKTKENSITINKLEPNHPYEVIVEAETKDQESTLDKFVVQTLTAIKGSEEKETEFALENGQTTAIFSDTESKIIFENVPDDDLEYTVQRNNEDIGKLKGKKNYIVERDLDSDTTYRYSVIGAVKLNKKEKEKAINAIKQQKMNPSDFNLDEVEKEYELARTIKTLKSNQTNSAAAESWEDPSPGVEFIYTTFIPYGPFTFKPKGMESRTNYHTGLGDNRSFDPYVLSDDYRTRTRARVSFPPSGGSKIRFTKLAHRSKGVNKNTGKWEVSGPIDMSRIYLATKTEGSTMASFTLNHEAGSPFAKFQFGGKMWDGPEIDYRYRADVYKNGYFKIVGYHDRAPSHELSFTPIPGETHTEGKFYSTLQPLFQFGMGNNPNGLMNLVGPPAYPQRSISEQGYWK